jgi:ribosomal protein S18 acetylase RimI-like enzyme
MIRPADPQDIAAIAALHIEGWKGAYGGLVDQNYLDSLSIEKRIQDWEGWMAAGESKTLIAEEEGRPAGFVTTGRTKTPPPGSSPIRPLYSAEVYALYLHPDFWRKGIGTGLLRQAATDLKIEKHSSLCLWVLDGNTRAKAFYEKMGGQKVGSKIVEIGPSKLKEVCYGWRDIRPFLIS